MAEFFGFERKRKGGEEPIRPSFVPNTDEDGAGVIQAGGHFGAYVDLDGDKAKSEIDLIYKYIHSNLLYKVKFYFVRFTIRIQSNWRST